MNKYRHLIDNCTGKVPKPYVKPKPLTGLEKESLANLEEISKEYHQEFGGNK